LRLFQAPGPPSGGCNVYQGDMREIRRTPAQPVALLETGPGGTSLLNVDLRVPIAGILLRQSPA
jgi:hypothetical protein